MTTDVLKLTEVTSGSAQNTVINQAIRDIEASIYSELEVDLTSGNATITSVSTTWQFLRYGVFKGTGHTVARTMTFPAPPSTRIFQVWNDGTADIDVEIGTTSIAVPTTEIYRFYADGTANGLIQIS